VTECRTLDSVALQAHAATLDEEQKVLSEELAIEDVMLQLDDTCGLSLGPRVIPDPGSVSEDPDLPTREQAFAMALQQHPKVLAAREAVKKARAEISAARDSYIPNLTGLARYSYQSGIPFLAHNFGTFGGIASFDLFDGGARDRPPPPAKPLGPLMFCLQPSTRGARNFTGPAGALWYFICESLRASEIHLA
jgi:outer membrane protein TolC